MVCPYGRRVTKPTGHETSQPWRSPLTFAVKQFVRWPVEFFREHMVHLDEERLFQLALEQLDTAGQAEAVAHLEHCEECRRRHASLSSIVFARTVAGDSGAKGPNTRPDRGTSSTGLQRGAALGRYVLLEKLGAGGMGEVFAAYDPQLDRKVALKLLRSGSLSAEEGKARLLREAQAMARLQHPNVIAVHDVGELADRVFIAMEFVDGETVAEWLRAMRSWAEVVSLFVQAGAGLSAAHRAGLIHRDFKPENVLLGPDGRPRVLDFGLARQSANTPPALTPVAPDVQDGDLVLHKTLTRDGAVMGTPGYMAPEQLAGLPTDERSDQYSFCVALFEALYGRRPFGGSTLKQHAQEMATVRLAEPPGSDVPRWVFEVLVRGLAPNPVDRWPDMQALLTALTPRAERRTRIGTGAAVLLVLALGGVGYGLTLRQRLTVCGGQEDALRGVWDRPTRATLREAFLGTGLALAPETWTNVEKTLDAWALEWVSTAREVCEATRVRKADSPELYELRRSCLDERLQRLKSLTTLFATPDRQVIVNASAAARSLDPAGVCGGWSMQRQGARDADERAAEAALRTHLADAQALFAAGKYAQVVAGLEGALGVSAPDRAKAEALLLLGRAKSKLGDAKGSTAAHLAAAEHAVRAADEALEAIAFSRLAANQGYDDHDRDPQTLLRLASAAASRVPGSWEVQAEVARNQALVELGRHNTLAAREQFERALALQRDHLPLEHPEIASTLNNLGMTLASLRLFDEAVRSLQQSLHIHEAVEGPAHPNTATAAHNLAVTLRAMGRPEDARPLFERALAIRRDVFGPDNSETLSTLQALARTELALGELEAASAATAQLKAAREGEGVPSKDRLATFELEAEIALAGGYWKEAESAASAMSKLARDEKIDVSLARGLMLEGRAFTALGQWSDARRVLNEVAALATDSAPDERSGELSAALGALEFGQSHWVEAQAHYERAVVALAPGSRAVGLARLELARCAVELHQPSRAATEVEQALALLQSGADRARVRLVAAQVAWLLNPDDAGTAAQAFAAELPELGSVERGRAEQWMRARHLALPDAGRP